MEVKRLRRVYIIGTDYKIFFAFSYTYNFQRNIFGCPTTIRVSYASIFRYSDAHPFI